MYLSGTSFAAPFVAATAALVRSAWPKLKAAQVIQRIRATATPARGGAGSPEYGAGIVDPYRAVTEGMTASARTVPAATMPPPNQQQLATQAWWRNAGAEARAMTSLTVASALVLALIGGLLAAGRHRRWTPGRSEVSRPEAHRDLSEPPPEHLFGRSS
jgi:subtilisin family serine protease